jgi:hypothetical protein
MLSPTHLCALAFATLAVTAAPLHAQSVDRRFEVGAHWAAVHSDEFGASEAGIGGRFDWLPLKPLGLGAEMTLYPGDYPDGVAFSSARWEALFGGTIGPRLGRVRPFAALRSGFVAYREAPEPFACIAIFPPPLSCTLAAGQTVPAFDFGGGVDTSLTDRSVVRVSLSARRVRFEGPAFGADRVLHTENFWSTGLRVAIGGGWRF